MPMPTRRTAAPSLPAAPPIAAEAGNEPDPRAILATLAATGASLEEAAAALRGLGLPMARVVETILADRLDPDEATVRFIMGLLACAEPGEAAPDLDAIGFPAIRLLAALDDTGAGLRAAMAGALTGDLALGCALAIYGRDAVFQHPDGRRYGAPFFADEQQVLRGRLDGSLWTPRDVTFLHGAIFVDPDRALRCVDLSMDALRAPEGRRNVEIKFKDCEVLERLPDLVAIGPQGTLNLEGCVSLVHLPARLRIGAGGILNLSRCFAWDGSLPPAADLGRNVTVVLPDGTAVGADTLLARAKGADVQAPKGKAALLRAGNAMAKALHKDLPHGLVGLLAQGGDRGTLVQILAEWLGRTEVAQYGSEMFLRNLERALEASVDLTLEALPLARAPYGGDWRVDRTASASYYAGPLPKVTEALVAFPPGLRPEGLWCRGLQRLEALPEGMQLKTRLNDRKVGGNLDVRECPAFRSLPNTLTCQNLTILDCPSWDRVLPAGVQVRGQIITAGHPEPGITLDAWRALHGAGPGT
jgi:hypothetical protein